MLAEAAFNVIAVAAIVSSDGLALDDINPTAHMDRSKHKGPTKIDRAF
ncbi:MAG: hypothetical protein WB792_03315 [Desulfobacterales bacterium]